MVKYGQMGNLGSLDRWIVRVGTGGESSKMNQAKPGVKLRSAVCTTEVVVVRPANIDVVISCCGVAMLVPGEEPAAEVKGMPAGEEVQIGRRYEHTQSGLEVLCAKPGPGPLSANGELLEVKSAKPLPASD